MSFIDDGEKGLPFELINLPGKARWPGSTQSVGRRAELLFLEERRRLKIIPNAFGEKPVLKLTFAALIRAAERWRGLRFTEFELRQIAAVRKDLDMEYEATVTVQTGNPSDAFPAHPSLDAGPQG